MIRVQCDGQSAGLLLVDDATPVLSATGSFRGDVAGANGVSSARIDEVVQMDLTVAQVAALAVMAEWLDPLAWREALLVEYRRARHE